MVSPLPTTKNVRMPPEIPTRKHPIKVGSLPNRRAMATPNGIKRMPIPKNANRVIDSHSMGWAGCTT